MAQYEITYNCGCNRIVNLFGSYDERDRKIEWLKTQDCPECKKAKIRSKVESINASKRLPALSGSEKQIVWAEEIRAFFVDYYDTFSPKIKTSKPEMINLLRDWLINHTDSKFWIDHRSYFETYRYADDDQINDKIFMSRIAEIYQVLYKSAIK